MFVYTAKKNMTDLMEVHHSHHPAHKKKWNEYLLKFFMLFLAVTLGFLAENLREHLTERKKEKEYIESFVDDLRKDTTEIANTSKLLFKFIHHQDTLIDYLQHYQNNDSINKKCYKHFLRGGVNIELVNFNENTLPQLLNTGSLRLLGKQNIIDSMLAYNDLIKQVKTQGSYYKNEFDKAFDYSSNIFDFSFIHARLNENFTAQPLMRYDTVHFRLATAEPKVLQQYTAYLIMEEIYAQDI
ncbi:MAG: hypothetical protein C4330_13530 [Chitinophagaceae bacterium]